jgi:hypothetical protein
MKEVSVLRNLSVQNIGSISRRRGHIDFVEYRRGTSHAVTVCTALISKSNLVSVAETPQG